MNEGSDATEAVPFTGYSGISRVEAFLGREFVQREEENPSLNREPEEDKQNPTKEEEKLGENTTTNLKSQVNGKISDSRFFAITVAESKMASRSKQKRRDAHSQPPSNQVKAKYNPAMPPGVMAVSEPKEFAPVRQKELEQRQFPSNEVLTSALKTAMQHRRGPQETNSP